MVINATFANISVISWRSVLLLGETEVHGENCRKSLTNLMLYRVRLAKILNKNTCAGKLRNIALTREKTSVKRKLTGVGETFKYI